MRVAGTHNLVYLEQVAVQDPAYPVYVDSSVIFGRSGKMNEV